jgi:hypothetical protein
MSLIVNLIYFIFPEPLLQTDKRNHGRIGAQRDLVYLHQAGQ